VHDDVEWSDEFDRGVEPLEREEALGLSHRAGEAVQQEAPTADVGLGQPSRDQFEDELVGYEVTVPHEGLDAPSERRALPHRGPEHIAGGNVGEPEAGGQPGALGALAGALAPEHDQPEALGSARRRRDRRATGRAAVGHGHRPVPITPCALL
jgi:hypothetical protein